MRKPRAADGFTLIELLFSVAITVVIIGVVGVALSVSLRASANTTGRLALSHDAEISARYFSGDVASTDPARINRGSGCTVAGVTGSSVVSFAWTETVATGVGTTSTVPHQVNWVYGSGLLERLSCGSTGNAALVMSRHLAGAPTVQCAPSPCGPTTQTVSLDVTEQPAATDVGASPYPFTLTGTVRSDSAPAAFTQPLPPLLALGGNGQQPVLQLGGLLSVNGAAVVDSGYSGAVSGCGSIQLYLEPGAGSCSNGRTMNLPVPLPDYFQYWPDPAAWYQANDPSLVHTSLPPQTGAGTTSLDGVYVLSSFNPHGNLVSRPGGHGVLIIVTGGTVDFSDTGFVRLAPISGADGSPYAGLSVWDNKGDTNNLISLTLGGSGLVGLGKAGGAISVCGVGGGGVAPSDDIGGLIYMPYALTSTLATNCEPTTVGGLVTSTMFLQGTGGVTIG